MSSITSFRKTREETTSISDFNVMGQAVEWLREQLTNRQQSACSPYGYRT